MSDFAINMLVLHSFGPPVIAALGPTSFVGFWISAAVASSTAHVVFNMFNKKKTAGALGASGAITASTILFALMHPKAQISIFFFIPVNALVGVCAFIAYDIYRASSGTNGRIDSAGHIGG
ncbi:hypothetical protein HK096_001113, partial [Nowakowskiella sp. JEL0078]